VSATIAIEVSTVWPWSLSLQRCNELIQHAIEKAAADYGRPICAAICDVAGFLVAFQRVDGAPIRSIAIAQAKAYSAARMQANTDALLERLRRENIALSYFCDDRLTALPGGSILKNAEGQRSGRGRGPTDRQSCCRACGAGRRRIGVLSSAFPSASFQRVAPAPPRAMHLPAIYAG
jgi:glc operon protein GlcG